MLIKKPVVKDKIIEILHEINTYKNENFGLLSGEAGLLLFEAYINKVELRNDFNDRIFKRVENIFDIVYKEKCPFSTFCSGLAGLGWTIEHIKLYELYKEHKDILLTDNVYVFISQQITNTVDYWDFLHGSIGMGYLFINSNSDFAIKIIDEIIDFLETTFVNVSKDIVKWAVTDQIDKTKLGYNISLSHGISSIIFFLIKVYLKGKKNKNKCESLMKWATHYILSQEINVTIFGSFFPSWSIEYETTLQGSRLAWCYGDLGIATTLWQAGVAMQNEQWKNKALEVLVYAAEKRRDLEKNGVVDAGLCHGTAGIGHIFYRMWWNTRMPEFKRAADYWFDRTLKMAKFSDGLAGYKAWQGTERGWQNEYGLLEGIAGIGLALLTYYHEVEPTWDECLLLS